MAGIRRVPRGAASLFAAVALGAALLDAGRVPPPSPLAGLRWLELAVALGLLVAFALRRISREREAWATPLDGRIAAMLAVLVLAALSGRNPFGGGIDLRVALGAVAGYYALAALIGRDPAAAELAWRVFPATAALLGLHALWVATTGLPRLAAASAAVDAGWGSHHGLLSALALATLFTLGRALEQGAAPAWRLAAFLGVLGVGLQLAAAGSPFATSTLARLEDPLGFSSVVVIVIVLKRAGHSAWTLCRERSAERTRWWGVMAAAAFVAVGVLFRPGSPGEAMGLLAATGGALVSAAHAQPAPPSASQGGRDLRAEPPPPRRRAA